MIIIKRLLNIKSYPRYIRIVFLSIIEYILGTKDAIRLIIKFPQLRNFKTLSEKNRQILKPHYEDYISRVSDDEWPISLKLATFLLTVCEIFNPKTILDLGSGFSSVVFRLYMKNATPSPLIVSVDDSPEWLEKTRTFLNYYQIPSGNLISWFHFKIQNNKKFDLILHDLGNMETREKVLIDVLNRVNINGIIVLDDIQFYNYRTYVRRLLKKLHLSNYSLRFFTREKSKRYALLIIR